MDDGAFGLSAGLFYVPSTFTPTWEVVELAKVAGRMGGIYISHMRDEAKGVLDSVRENVVVASNTWDPSMAGRNLAEITLSRNMPVTLENAAETALWMVEKGGAQGIFHAINEEDLQRILVHPATMVASDGEVAIVGRNHPHPRSYGTFVRVLGLYARDKKLLPLETAVQKMTSFPAQRLGLFDRGVLRPGLKADIAVFDAARVRDTATFEKPHSYAEGVTLVIVNGQVAFEGEEVNASPRCDHADASSSVVVVPLSCRRLLLAGARHWRLPFFDGPERTEPVLLGGERIRPGRIRRVDGLGRAIGIVERQHRGIQHRTRHRVDEGRHVERLIIGEIRAPERHARLDEPRRREHPAHAGSVVERVGAPQRWQHVATTGVGRRKQPLAIAAMTDAAAVLVHDLAVLQIRRAQGHAQ